MGQRGEDLDPLLITNVFASQKGFLLKINHVKTRLFSNTINSILLETQLRHPRSESPSRRPRSLLAFCVRELCGSLPELLEPSFGGFSLDFLLSLSKNIKQEKRGQLPTWVLSPKL